MEELEKSGELALLGGTPTIPTGFPWPIWGDAERAELSAVLESGHWGCLSGSRVAEFEATFAQYQDAKHCICTTSGTTALQTALVAWGVAPGDEVVIPAYTFAATASAVLNVGAVPVFADIAPDTYNIDPESVVRCITEKTRAVIAVHIGGSPAALNRLKPIAAQRGLLLLEDAAQAVGAVYDGRKVGAIGHMGCFSFQATKNLNCGDGGAIVTDDDELAARCRSIVNCGRPDPAFAFRVPGTNFRMTEFQAAILLAQMTRLEAQSVLRDSNYRALERELSSLRGVAPAKAEPATDRRGCHLFMFGYNASDLGGLGRETFVAALGAEGVPCCCGYVPLYRNELFSVDRTRYPELYRGHCRGLAYETVRLPVTEQVCERSVWILQQALLADDVGLIAGAVGKVVRHSAKLLEAQRAH